MAQMGFGHNKAVHHFKELEGIGLIERKKQGQGKPTRIYVKNFILPPEPGHSLPSPEAPPQTSQKRKSALPSVKCTLCQGQIWKWTPIILDNEMMRDSVVKMTHFFYFCD